MCSILKFKNTTKIMGDVVPCVNASTNRPGTAQWSGFIRERAIKWWKTKGAVDILIPAEGFIENNYYFRISKSIRAIGLTKDVYTQNGKYKIGDAKTIKIVTREALNKREKLLQLRWPICFHFAGQVQVFLKNT